MVSSFSVSANPFEKGLSTKRNTKPWLLPMSLFSFYTHELFVGNGNLVNVKSRT